MSLLDEVKAWPMPERTHFPGWSDVPYYTADQLRAAREAVAAEADREMAQMDQRITQLLSVLDLALVTLDAGLVIPPASGPHKAFRKALSEFSAALSEARKA